MTLDRLRCVNLIKVFLFGIKDKLNMKKVNVDFTECSYSGKCIVIKILKSFDHLRMFLYILGKNCNKVVITC